MLTRIEIDGFKTFEGFGLDLGPMQVILEPNASGKSNLFDAIRLLSNLAGSDLRSSVRDLRGEPVELFRICSCTVKRIALIPLLCNAVLAQSVLSNLSLPIGRVAFLCILRKYFVLF